MILLSKRFFKVFIYNIFCLKKVSDQKLYQKLWLTFNYKYHSKKKSTYTDIWKVECYLKAISISSVSVNYILIQLTTKK